MDLRSRFEGTLVGLALGDALGAPHEGGPVERLAWKVLGLGKKGLLRWTDDTEMSIVTVESLLERGRLDLDHLAKAWADRYSLGRGYGIGALQVLGRIRAGEDWRTANRIAFPDGSYGNGAAMRAAPLGLRFHRDTDELVRNARAASTITHAHPLGVEGGILIALATSQALADRFDPDALAAVVRETPFRERLARVPTLLAGEPEPREIVRQLGNGIAAAESAVTALYLWRAHHERSFEDLMAAVVSLGGDADTIGAMAGALFGASRGIEALPSDVFERLEEGARIRELASKLHDATFPSHA